MQNRLASGVGQAFEKNETKLRNLLNFQDALQTSLNLLRLWVRSDKNDEPKRMDIKKLLFTSGVHFSGMLSNESGESKNLSKILNKKYIYTYAEAKNQNISIRVSKHCRERQKHFLRERP